MKKEKKRFQMSKSMKVFSVSAACVVVFATTYSLILPAITMDEETAEDLSGVYLDENVAALEEFSADWDDGNADAALQADIDDGSDLLWADSADTADAVMWDESADAADGIFWDENMDTADGFFLNEGFDVEDADAANLDGFSGFDEAADLDDAALLDGTDVSGAGLDDLDLAEDQYVFEEIDAFVDLEGSLDGTDAFDLDSEAENAEELDALLEGVGEEDLSDLNGEAKDYEFHAKEDDLAITIRTRSASPMLEDASLELARADEEDDDYVMYAFLDKDPEQAQKVLADAGYDAEQIRVRYYSIELTKEGAAFELADPVKAELTFTSPEVADDLLIVTASINEDGEWIFKEAPDTARVMDGMIRGTTFESDSLSLFAIIVKDESAAGVLVEAAEDAAEAEEAAEIENIADGILVEQQIAEGEETAQDENPVAAEEPAVIEEETEASAVIEEETEASAVIEEETEAYAVIEEETEEPEAIEEETEELTVVEEETEEPEAIEEETEESVFTEEETEDTEFFGENEEDYAAGVLTAAGDTYEITVTYDTDAQIPEGAQLEVTEITEDMPEYETYRSKAQETVDPENSTNEEVTYARFFEIRILADGIVIEPKVQVQVTINLLDKDTTDENISYNAVYITENDTTVMNADVEDEIRFETSELS